jgi:hypothetical protein
MTMSDLNADQRLDHAVREMEARAQQPLRRTGFGVPMDEFGIPINTPANYDPIPMGVQDEYLGIFPKMLADIPYPLLPCAVHMCVKKKLVKPGDASLVQQMMANAFRFIRKEGGKPKTLSASAVIKDVQDLSKAYYSCDVPEILFVHNVLPELELAIIDDLTVYVEKLLNMGFIKVPTQGSGRLAQTVEEETAIHQTVPCIVIVGHGFLYQRFLKNFYDRIEHLGTCQDERKSLRKLLLGRVVRGMTNVPKDPNAAIDPDAIASLSPEPAQVNLTIAGGLNQTQRQIQHSLGRQGVVTKVEHQALNSAERLEVQQIHNILQGTLLSRAYIAWEGTQKGRNQLSPIAVHRQGLQGLMFQIGLKRHAFASYETPSHLPLACDKHSVETISDESYSFLLDELRDFLPALLAYAKAHELEDGIETLAAIVDHHQALSS